MEQHNLLDLEPYHTHNHPEHLPPREPLTSKTWQRIAEKGNGASALLQAGAWVVTGQAGALIDAFHNWTDKVGYKKEGQNLHDPELSEQQRLRNRKIVHWLFFSTSMFLGAKAGVEIATDNEPGPDMFSVYSGGVSVALSTFLLVGLGKGMLRRRKTHPDKKTRYTATEKMRIKHVREMDVPSAVLSLAGAIGQYHHPSAGNAAGIASGVLGMWLFAPTAKNVGHNCSDHESDHEHDHGHEHEYEHDHNHQAHDARHTSHHEPHNHNSEARPKWRNRLRRRAAAAALAFGALASTVVLTNDTAPEHIPAKQAQEQVQKQPKLQPPFSALPVAPGMTSIEPSIPAPVQQPRQSTIETHTVTVKNNMLTVRQTIEGTITAIEGTLGKGENPWTITQAALEVVHKDTSPQDIAAANSYLDPSKQEEAKTLQPGTIFRWVIENGKPVPATA